MHEDKSTDDAVVVLVRIAIVPSCPGIDRDQAHVGNATFGHGSLEVRVVPHGFFGLAELIHDDRWLHALDSPPARYCPIGQGGHDLMS